MNNTQNIIKAPFPEQKGEKLQAIDKSLKELRKTLKDDNRLEYDFSHHQAVLMFVSTVIHPACCEDTKDYLSAISFILEWVAKDLERLHDAETETKEAVQRYLFAMEENG